MQITQDYQTLIAQLEKNDSNFVHLDFKDMSLTILQLEEIASKIQDNDFIGNVSWGKMPNASGDLVQKIESKIILNNQNYKRHPNDFIHGLLSLHAYIDSKPQEKVIFENSKYNQYLKDWKIFKIFSESKIGRYYAVAYINDKTKQIVFAHRGTTFEVQDLLKTDSPLKTHFKSILGGQIVAQQAASYQATEEITEYAKNHHYNLSFTGYSLGAWFAELSLYFAHQDFNYSKAKAITFDSPGSAIIMDSFKPNIISHETHFDIRNLNITTYLSAPNFVNTSNPHIHKAYRLFPEVTAIHNSSKIINTINKAIPIKSYIALLSLNSDLLDSMLNAFDPETGKPVRYEKILDWPCIKYEPKDDTLGDIILDFIPAGGIANKLIKRGITATTLGSFIEIIDHFVSGNIAIEQILEIYKYLENPTQIKGKNQFELSYKGHYKSQKVNLSEDVVNVNDKRNGDWYLCQLAELNLEVKEIPDLVRKQLTVIKEQYEIEHKNDKDYIFTRSSNIKVDDLREQILRLVEVSKEAKKILKDRNIYSANYIGSVNSNLPTLSVYNLIHREDAFKQIDKALSKNSCVAISAFAGTGKTTLAMEYGRKQIEEARKIVRFINADSAYKINEAYRQLAKELGINVEAEKEEEIIINLVCNKINNLNSNILFIFDNVEAYKDIELYINGIMNIPKNKAQAIITTKNNNLSEDIKNIRLEPFNEDEATKYLEKSLGNSLSNQDINILLKEFSDKNTALPYSMSKAVAYFKNNKLLKVKDYLNFLRNNKDEQPETMLLLEIVEKSPIAWLILQCSAYLDPDFISIDIFKELLPLDEEKLQEPIKKLEALSLMNLTCENGKNGLQLHRLVQKSVEKYADNHKKRAIDKQKIYTSLIEVLNNLFPILTDIPNEDWEISKLLYPHVIKILNDNISADNIIRVDKCRKASLYQKIGFYDEEILYKFENVLKYHQEALKLNQELYQSDHPNLACSLNDVGLAYSKIGELGNALKYCEEALEMRQKLFQVNHPETAKSLNNVGLIYKNLGQFSKGLIYLDMALEMRKILYEGNHPDIANSFYNLGSIHQKLGRFSEGLSCFKVTLKIRKILYEGNHPDIARSLTGIGTTYQQLGQYSKALNYLEAALEMNKIIYEGNHPDIANSLNNLGLIYKNLKKFSEGLSYLEAALEMSKILYRGNHSDIVGSLNNIGTTYQQLGQFSKALSYLEAALEMSKKLYEGNHYDIANFIANIGIAYYYSGDTNKAIELHKQAYLMYVQTLGLEHFHTKNLESYIKIIAPEFIKNNETRELILQRGDFEEVTLDVKQRIQKKVLDKIYINAAKGKWCTGKFRFLGIWGVKGYLCDKYLAKQLKDLSSPPNIEIAKMLCFEAICLGAINHPSKDFICAIEFTKSYPELTQKITTEHPEYFIDGSILRSCIKDEAILSKLLHSLNSNI